MPITSKLIRALALPLALVATSSGLASTWSSSVSYRFAGGTSLKVLEPQGYRASVSLPDGQKEDVIPTVFALPDADAFVLVTISNESGTVWTQKIEIRRGHQTELTVKGTTAAPPKAPRSFVGRVANFTSRCDKASSGELQFEFIQAANGASAGKLTLTAEAAKTVDLTSGRYDVRISWRKSAATAFSYQSTMTLAVDRDDWLLAWGCRQAGQRPGLLQRQ